MPERIQQRDQNAIRPLHEHPGIEPSGVQLIRWKEGAEGTIPRRSDVKPGIQPKPIREFGQDSPTRASRLLQNREVLTACLGQTTGCGESGQPSSDDGNHERRNDKKDGRAGMRRLSP